MANQWHKIIGGETLHINHPTFICFKSMSTGYVRVELIKAFRSEDYLGDFMPVAWQLVTFPKKPFWVKEK